MKKLFYFASALALLLASASCQRENLEPVTEGNVVTYTVQVPGALATKAIGEDVSAVTELVYEVYRTEATSEDDHTQTETKLFQNTATITNGTATVDFELVNNQNFRVLFWAQVKDNGVYTVSDLTNVTLKQTLTANAENYAAFAGTDYINSGDKLAGRTITLARPIAQLNIGTDDESLSIEGQTTVEIETTAVTVKGLSTTFNVAEDKAGEISTAAYVYSAASLTGLSEQTFPVNGTNYNYVAMNYVGFAPELGANVEVSYTINTKNVGTITNTIDNVPVKANHRTNIVGNLITSTSDYTITLSEKWEGELPDNMADQLAIAAQIGGEIKLEENLEFAETVTVAEGVKLVIDLNGKTITGAAKNADGKFHLIVNNGNLTIKGGNVEATAENGGSAIYNTGLLTLNNVTVVGAPSNTATGTASYAVHTLGDDSKLIINDSNISGRGAIGAENGTKVEINGGTYHTPAVAWGHAVYADGEGTEVVINGGTFSEGYEMSGDNWGMYQIYSGNKAKVVVNGGTFMPWDCANGYDLCTASEGTIVIYGGDFAENPTSQNNINYVAEGYIAVEVDGFYRVLAGVASESKEAFETALSDPSINTINLSTELDYTDVETVVIEKDVTIYADGETISAGGNSSLTPSVAAMGDYDVVIDNANIVGGFVGAYYGADVVVDGGSLTFTDGKSGRNCFYAAGTDEKVTTITIKDIDVNMANASGNSYLCAQGNAIIYVEGGNFYGKPAGSSNPYVKEVGYGSYTGQVIITGGTFNFDPSEWVANDFLALKNADDTYTVVSATKEMEDGAVLDLNGVEFLGTVVALGDLTVKGDTKIKTLKATNGGTITIEDGKTLTLNNFSFGASANADAVYEIKGGTVAASYGFFQHGTYALHSDFETGYMYYSYGSDITVYGTFHSQGLGDGLDYVRGKLTIANGGKSIHDKSLWVGQPASWGAMEASLTIEDGGYVQANSLSVYAGSSLTYYNDADLSCEWGDKTGTIITEM